MKRSSFVYAVFPRPPWLLLAGSYGIKRDTAGLNFEKPMFRINHQVLGPGLVVDYQIWNEENSSYLYSVEFDSGESALVFSSACQLEILKGVL